MFTEYKPQCTVVKIQYVILKHLSLAKNHVREMVVELPIIIFRKGRFGMVKSGTW